MKAFGVVFAILTTVLLGVTLLSENVRGGDGIRKPSRTSEAIAERPAETGSKPSNAAKGEMPFCSTHCGFSTTTKGWPDVKRAAKEASLLKISVPVQTKDGVRIDDVEIGYEKPRAVALLDYRWNPGQTLHVVFLDHNDDRELLRTIATYGNQWSSYANLKFLFYTAAGFPRDTPAEITVRIEGLGGQSAVGTGSLHRKEDWSMRLGVLGQPESEVRAITLHEFGHAIGLMHEHQHPKNTIRWKQPLALNWWMKNQGWNAQEVREQIFEPLQGHLGGTDFDLQSIMLYPIPGFLTEDGLEVGRNSELSLNDKKVAAWLYPPQSNSELQSYIKAAPGFVKNANGVSVCALRPHSPLKHLHDAAGRPVTFRPGSIVTSLAGVEVKEPSDLEGAAKKADSGFHISFLDPEKNTVVTAVGPVKGDPKDWPTP